MNRFTRQRGSIIIYAMLTMSAMLAIGLTLSGLFIGKLRSAANTRNSAVALYVTDSVVEMCLYEARAGSDEPPIAFSAELSGATYEITESSAGIDITDNCKDLGSGSFDFRATGMYRGVRRTLEITQ